MNDYSVYLGIISAIATKKITFYVKRFFVKSGLFAPSGISNQASLYPPIFLKAKKC